VIVDPSGLIVTSLHVIAGAQGIVVNRFHMPHQHLPAQLVRTDITNDLAMLRINVGQPIPAATLADSDQVQVGDWVLAVGHPFGLGLTVTAGIVGRRNGTLAVPGGMQYTGLLQTDAPINEGSSGGPLVDVQGQVVGINTAIYAPTGVFSGTGFAIPSVRVAQFLGNGGGGMGQTVAMQMPIEAEQMPIAAEQMPIALTPAGNANQVGGAWLGLDLVPVTPNMAEQLAFREGTGVMVSRVALNSPADEAQLVKGDIVTSLGQTPIQDMTTAQGIVQSLAPGQVVPVQIWRNGTVQNLMLQARVRPASVW
jgi:serine protease Do